MSKTNICVIGGGIIGSATALMIRSLSGKSVTILEAEPQLAAHQTGNNSGVIHSGLYYKPGSLKAINCAVGREMMYKFCIEYGINYEKCGKLVVATNKKEIPVLKELENRGRQNGLTGILTLKGEQLKDYEPYVNGVAGLYIPDTGIVDYSEVTKKFAELILANGGEIKLDHKFLSARATNGSGIIETTQGELEADIIVNCAGLHSDVVAKKCGVDPGLMIIPFRGEYYKLKENKKNLVKNLIYPVPDPRFPFLGVHFTRMINGDVEAGPNAVLAFKREGYSYKDISIGDLFKMFTYPGFWKMAGKHYKMAAGEFHRSLSKSAFVTALQQLIPDIETEDLERGGAGVRAQALDPDGKLIDDFRIIESKNMVHVLNAPSPAATASLSIGKKIAEIVLKKF